METKTMLTRAEILNRINQEVKTRKDAIELIMTEREEDSMLNMTLDDFLPAETRLKQRTIRILNKEGIHTLWDLVSTFEYEISTMRKIGPEIVRYLTQFLNERGLSFREFD